MQSFIVLASLVFDLARGVQNDPRLTGICEIFAKTEESL